MFYATKYYKNIKELENFWLSKNDIIIVDEYDQELTWNELKKELINWNKNNTKSLSNIDYSYIDEFGYDWETREFS